MLIALLLLCCTLTVCIPAQAFAAEQSLEDLKKRAAEAKLDDQPNLVAEAARRELAVVDERVNAGKGGEAIEYLGEAVNDAILASDAAVKASKRQKETEISIRKMIHHMKDVQRQMSLDDSQVMQRAIDRMEKLRTQLLGSMFSQDKK